LENHDRQARAHRAVVLDELPRAVVLLLLTDVEGIEGPALLEADEGHGAREGAAAELDARDGLAGRELVQRLVHELADEGVALGRENRLLAVDEEVALAARGQNHALPLEGALAQELDQPRLLVGRHRVFFLMAALAPLRRAG